jgi:hypothetical protein
MNKSNIVEVTNLFDLKQIMQSCMTVILGFTVPVTPDDAKVMVRKFLKRKAEKFPLITFVYMEVSDQDRQTLNILRGTIDQYPKIYHIRQGNDVLVNVQAANIKTINKSFDEVEKYYIEDMKNFRNNIKNKNKALVSNDQDRNPGTRTGGPVAKGTRTGGPVAKGTRTGGPVAKGTRTGVPVAKGTRTGVPVAQGTDDSDVDLSSNDGVQDNDKNNKNPVTNENTGQNQQTVPDIPDPVLEKKKNIEKLILLNKTYNDMQMDLARNIAKRKKIENKIEIKNSKNKKNDDGKEYRKNIRKNK